MKKSRWTETEDVFLKNNYGKISTKEISEKLKRSIVGIYGRKIKLGIRVKTHYRGWRENEHDKFIINNYQKMTAKNIGVHLGRSEASINNRKVFLMKSGIIEKKNGWTEEERNILIENINKSCVELHKILPRKSSSWIATIKKRMGFGTRKNRGFHYVKDGIKVFPDGKGKRIYEHRLLIEKELGRKLLPEEKIHHIDGVKNNNDTKNLFVCSNSGHMKAHTSLYALIEPMLEKKIITFNREKGIYEII